MTIRQSYDTLDTSCTTTQYHPVAIEALTGQNRRGLFVMNIPDKGLYLKDSADIVSEDKSAFATPTPTDLSGRRALIVKDGKRALIPGLVTIEPPTPLTPEAFDAQSPIHGISRYDRLSWWPDAQTLYLHELTYDPLPEPITLDFPAGIATNVDMTKILPTTVKAVILDRTLTDDGFTHTYGIIGD